MSSRNILIYSSSCVHDNLQQCTWSKKLGFLSDSVFCSQEHILLTVSPLLMPVLVYLYTHKQLTCPFDIILHNFESFTCRLISKVSEYDIRHLRPTSFVRMQPKYKQR